jgi:hypothetical protein
MEVEDNARAGLPRRGQRPPAERRVDVVGVDDARPRPPDGPADVVGIEPAPQHADRRAGPADDRRVPLEQLGVLAEPVANQPKEVVDRPLLAAGRAITIVQEENDRLMLPYSGH